MANRKNKNGYGGDHNETSVMDNGDHPTMMEFQSVQQGLVSMGLRLDELEKAMSELKSAFGASNSGGVKPADSVVGQNVDTSDEG